MFKFGNPYWLLLLIGPFIAAWLLHRHTGSARIVFSAAPRGARIDPGIRARLIRLPDYLRLLVLVLAIVALARPQNVVGQSRVKGEGIDIVIAIDYSTSMLAEDFPPNRFGAAKQVSAEFIDGRANDRIALVIYAGEAFTQVPLTLDYRLIKQILSQVDFLLEPLPDNPNINRYVQVGGIPGNTAIGDALVESLARLRQSNAKSKVIILVSDGENNAGRIDPLEAAALAKKMGVRVYTIGIGGPRPVSWPMAVSRLGEKLYTDEKTKLDEQALKKIAEATDGAYFRATDEAKLRQIYQQIDSMEKSQVEVEHFDRADELFLYFLIPAIFLLLAELFLRNTMLRTSP